MMKPAKHLIAIATLLLSLSAFAETYQETRPDLYEAPECQASQDAQQVAQRGCCSWHGGVCGCQGGRIVCCDGGFSPSCGCNREDSVTAQQNEDA